MYILLLAAIGAKLIGPHGGLQVGKNVVPDEQAAWNDPLQIISLAAFLLVGDRKVWIITSNVNLQMAKMW